MHKIIPVLTISLTTLVATSAMAGFQHDHYDKDQSRYSQSQTQDYQHTPNKYDNRYNSDRYDDRRTNNMSRDQYKYRQNIKPARDWRAGQTLPRQFNPNAYAVSYKDASRLYKPNKNQQWLKINGDYVLINERNNKIVRIIA